MSDKAKGAATGPGAYFWDCGVPPQQCSAGRVLHNSKFRGHGSKEEASRCGRRYTEGRNADRAGADPLLLPPTPQRLKRGKAGRTMGPRIRG